MIFEQSINRPTPALGPEFFTTYEVSRPTSTHFRKATCVEVDCPNRERGWRSTIDVSTQLGQGQARYIRLHSGRHFTTTAAGTLVMFDFAPGQECFSQHRVPLDREPAFRKLDGDWRRYGGARELRAKDWLEDFGEHQLLLAEQRQRG